MFKATRKRNKLNQDEMAEILNVTQKMISKYERRESHPEFEKLYKFQKKFGIEALIEEMEKEFELLDQELF